MSTAFSVLTNDLNDEEKSMQKNLLKMFAECPQTHWEGFELESFNQNQKEFEKSLLNGLKK